MGVTHYLILFLCFFYVFLSTMREPARLRPEKSSMRTCKLATHMSLPTSSRFSRGFCVRRLRSSCLALRVFVVDYYVGLASISQSARCTHGTAAQFSRKEAHAEEERISAPLWLTVHELILTKLPTPCIVLPHLSLRHRWIMPNIVVEGEPPQIGST